MKGPSPTFHLVLRVVKCGTKCRGDVLEGSTK